MKIKTSLTVSVIIKLKNKESIAKFKTFIKIFYKNNENK